MEDNWERRVLERLATDGLREQRRARRWGIFFKLLAFGFLFFVLFAALGAWTGSERLCLDKCTAMVEIQGEIDATGRASADNVIAGLQAAFKNKGTQGVVLKINSPGGSPVQAGEINDEIRRLRGKYPDTPIYAVVEEICASGAYYVAVAADKIYVDKASLVGSIGVIMDGFGFVGTLDKLGIERRALTAGDNKAFLDPFLPLTAKQKEYAQQMLGDIHQQFIAVVRGRARQPHQGFPGAFFGPGLERKAKHRARPHRRIGQRSIGGAGRRQSRGHRRFHGAGKRGRARRAEVWSSDGKKRGRIDSGVNAGLVDKTASRTARERQACAH